MAPGLALGFDYRYLVDLGSYGGLDIPNLIERAWHDMAIMETWPSDEERDAQYGIVREAVARLPEAKRRRIDPIVMTVPPKPLASPTMYPPRPERQWWEGYWSEWLADRRDVRRGKAVDSYVYYRDVVDAMVRRDVRLGLN